MIEHFAVTWLVNALWLVPLIAAATALGAGLGRLGPRTGHCAWLAALALAVSLPALPAAAPSLRFAPAAWFRAISPSAVPLATNATAASIATDDQTPISPPPADPLPLLAFDQAWTQAILYLVAGFVALALCRLLIAIWGGGRLVRAALPHDLDPAVRRALSRISARDTRPLPPILESEAIASPVVVGVARPAILVPPGFADLSWDEQCAALLHEMAHVSRRDYAWNLVCEAVSLPLAWHPAILIIKAGVRRSREAACDTLAAEAMASRMTYARCLVSIASRLGAAHTSSAVAVGLIGKSDLEERLMNLINPKPGRVSSVLRVAGATAVAAAILAPAVFLRATPAFADDEPVIARRLLAPAPDGSVEAASPVARTAPITPAAIVSRASMKHVATARRIAEGAASIHAPSSIAPVEPSAPTPPAPPLPPADTMNGEEIHHRATDGRYDVIVHRALEQAVGAERVMESETMRHALAELHANQEEMTKAEQAKIHAEVATAIAQLDHAHLNATLDKLRSQLRSSKIRNAIAEAARQAATAAVEGYTDDGKD